MSRLFLEELMYASFIGAVLVGILMFISEYNRLRRKPPYK